MSYPSYVIVSNINEVLLRHPFNLDQIRDSEFTLRPLLPCSSEIKLLSLVLLFSKNVLGNTAKLGATETTTAFEPAITQQARTTPKFFILRRWVLCHFTHDKHTNAWNSLGMHKTNSTSTEMLNYHWHFEVLPIDSPKKQCRKCHAKSKFHRLRRWVLCHFAHEKPTKAWNFFWKACNKHKIDWNGKLFFADRSIVSPKKQLG